MNDEPILYLNADESPKFIGESGLEKFIYTNLEWPKKSDIVEGKVIVSFVINSLGYVEKIRIEKSLCKECDEEVVRVLNIMPKWKPGKLNKKKISVLIYLPVYFTLLNKSEY